MLTITTILNVSAVRCQIVKVLRIDNISNSYFKVQTFFFLGVMTKLDRARTPSAENPGKYVDYASQEGMT